VWYRETVTTQSITNCHTPLAAVEYLAGGLDLKNTTYSQTEKSTISLVGIRRLCHMTSKIIQFTYIYYMYNRIRYEVKLVTEGLHEKSS
jgi:hypothetical protein